MKESESKKTKNIRKEELGSVAEKWKALERKTQEQRQKAERYYEEHVFPQIEQTYVDRNHDVLMEQVDYLIMSVGTSYEPLVLNIKLLCPGKILFLYTDKSEKILDKIVDHCKLTNSRYLKERVDETNPLDIYRCIKEAYIEWHKPEKIFVDFTGGTKAMSAAAAMAGAMIDIQLLYVGNTNYLQDFRKPDPGSEILCLIDNPVAIFGDLEINKIYALYERYNYAGACERLLAIKDSIPDPELRTELEYTFLLSSAYKNWDALDFDKAFECMDRLCTLLKRDAVLKPHNSMITKLPIIQWQRSMLDKLRGLPAIEKNEGIISVMNQKEYLIPLMFTLLINAHIREKQTKLDMATLLLYRVLEMMEQRRLALYNIDASRSFYDHMKNTSISKQELTDRLNATRESIFKGKQQPIQLPIKIALMDGFMILAGLQDELIGENQHDIEVWLQKIKADVSLRNRSIFAHGLVAVDKVSYKKFSELVRVLFLKFCQIEHINYDEYMYRATWVELREKED